VGRVPWLIGIVVKVLFGFWALSVATGKGRSGGWFWLAFFFPVIGVIVAYCLEDRSGEDSGPYYGPTYVQNVQCPFANDNRAPYLPEASRALPSPVKSEEGKEWVICAGCGERATLYYAKIRKQCPKCDTPYVFAEKPEEIVVDEAGTAADASESAAPSPDRRCAACGQAMPSGAAYCMFCGEKASTGWACPRCSAANPAAALFCMNCGGRRESGPPA
jgi:hypothetical protein